MVENFKNISEQHFKDTLRSYIQIPVWCILKHLTVEVFMDTLKSRISKLHIKRSFRGLPGLFFKFSFSVFIPKNFSFTVWCSLRFTGFRFRVFDFRYSRETLLGFRIWYPMRFSVFFYLGSGFSLIWPAIMCNHWLWIAAKPLYAPLVITVSDRLEFW